MQVPPMGVSGFGDFEVLGGGGQSLLDTRGYNTGHSTTQRP